MTMLLDGAGDHLMASSVKLAPRSASIDNYAGGRTGTVIATIDPASGVICELRPPRPGGFGAVHAERHPVTGAELIGVRMPLWDEVHTLAERASAAFLPLRTIGWDIAVTPAGPLLIEGNARWDPPPVDATSGAILRRMREAGG